MNEKINDGGPAFPMPEQQFTGGMDGYYGMSLRDYFAAKAMQAIMSTPKPEFHTSADDVSLMAYQMADAMLKARQS